MAEVSDTAATIARVRAEEAERPPAERLFEDPYATLFARGLEEVDARFLAVPYFREAIRLRTRLIDDFVRAEIASGVRQITILGVGFDCRALRLAEVEQSGSRVFEVDFASQLERKATMLAASQAPVPSWVRAVPCDFTATGYEEALVADLVRAGFRRDERAAILCEGVIGYLDEAAAARVLRLMATMSAPGSAAIVNYSINRFGPEALREKVLAAGFVSVDNQAFGAAHRRLIAPDAPNAADLFHVAVART